MKRDDGRFYYDYGGNELCYLWGRNENGCSDPIVAKSPKDHTDVNGAWGQHRSIHRPVHPNWVPDGPGKGKGKGKGKAGAGKSKHK